MSARQRAANRRAGRWPVARVRQSPRASSLDLIQTVDASEADQVLAVLTLRADGKPVDDWQWQRLLATEPYQRLKEREAEIGQQFHIPTLAFTESDFKKFVLSGDLRVVDWEAFLAGFAGGKTNIEYGANRNIFCQGQPADSVFYLRLSVVLHG